MLHGVRSLPEESAQPHARTLDPTDVLLSEWLSQHPEKDLAPVALAARVAHLSHVLRQRIEKPLDRFGLDWGLFMVLVALRGAGRPFRMSPHELHRLLLLSPAAVTNRLYRLQLKGLVDRMTDPTDRRSVPVVLTPQGQSTVDRAMAACVGADVGLQDVEPDDLAVTIRTVHQLLAGQDRPAARAPARARSLSGPTQPAPPEPAAPLVALAPAAPSMWPESNRELERLQRRLARRACDVVPWAWPGNGEPNIGGVFVSVSESSTADVPQGIAWAGAVVMEGTQVVATATATRRLPHPYLRGRLAISVGPILEDLIHALSQPLDVIVINGAGSDHVRGAGLAMQLGAALDVATVGVTEHPEIGLAPEPGSDAGYWTPVRVQNRLTGFRVRTIAKARPITAHAAWRTRPETARDVVIRTTARGLRFPEPLHRARQLSTRLRGSSERSLDAGLHDGIHDVTIGRAVR